MESTLGWRSSIQSFEISGSDLVFVADVPTVVVAIVDDFVVVVAIVDDFVVVDVVVDVATVVVVVVVSFIAVALIVYLEYEAFELFCKSSR